MTHHAQNVKVAEDSIPYSGLSCGERLHGSGNKHHPSMGGDSTLEVVVQSFPQAIGDMAKVSYANGTYANGTYANGKSTSEGMDIPVAVPYNTVNGEPGGRTVRQWPTSQSPRWRTAVTAPADPYDPRWRSGGNDHDTSLAIMREVSWGAVDC